MQIATESGDLAADLKRGLSYVRKQSPARKRKEAARRSGDTLCAVTPFSTHVLFTSLTKQPNLLLSSSGRGAVRERLLTLNGVGGVFVCEAVLDLPRLQMEHVFSRGNALASRFES